uniref:Uncharacterized protein n=1 Tax=Oryza sativa subsp. japonica TaxID=39947 RepID=Q6ZLJ8_ORYSJ|nr:hypothetical protein [Oryza sativa Japonica Group]
MSPAHRRYLHYAHHLHNNRNPCHPDPIEDAPDLEPDPAVLLTTTAGHASRGAGYLQDTGRRAAAGSADSTAAALPPSPSPPPSATTPPRASRLDHHHRQPRRRCRPTRSVRAARIWRSLPPPPRRAPPPPDIGKREAPPLPSLQPRGFADGGEAEEGGGREGAAGSSSPEPPQGRATREEIGLGARIRLKTF